MLLVKAMTDKGNIILFHNITLVYTHRMDQISCLLCLNIFAVHYIEIAEHLRMIVF